MEQPAPGRPLLRLALKLALLVAVLVAASYVGNWVNGQLNPYLTPSTEPALHRMIMTAMAVFVVLMMLPFVPGAEIGLGLLVVFGPKIVPLVYAGTVLALLLAFLIGRLVPERAIIEAFETLRLRRAGALLRRLEPLESDQRLQLLLENASSRIMPFLLRHRFVALAIAFNLPGNVVLGGGGGIGLMAGFSRLFPLPSYALTVAIAVSPVPLVILITGS